MTHSHSPINTFLIVFSKKYANMGLTGWFTVSFHGRVLEKINKHQSEAEGRRQLSQERIDPMNSVGKRGRRPRCV